MASLYRLTVRMNDGTRYISDYTELRRANLQRRLFFPGNDKIIMDWEEGPVIVTLRLEQITGVSIEEINNSSQQKTLDQEHDIKTTYENTIKILEARI